MAGRTIQRNRLTRKLVLAVLFFSLFITVIVTGVQTYIEYKKDLRRIDNQMMLVESSYVPSLVNSLWELNTDQVMIIVKGIVSLPGIEYVAIIKDGKRDFAEGVLASRNTIEKEFPLVSRLKNKEIHLGVLRVVNSVDLVYQELLSHTKSILIANAVTIFIVSGFIFIIIQLFVVRHLVDIIDYTQSIDLDNIDNNVAFSQRASNLVRPDEIDQIFISINQMQDRIVQDLNNRRLAETALQESEEKFRNLFENAVVGVGISSVDGKILEINDALLRMIGHTRHTARDVRIGEIYEKPDVRNQMIEKLQRDGFVENFECRLIHREKGPFWISLSANRIRYKNENAIQVSILDITERKRMENELIQSHKMEAIGTLAGGIAHDFNNILASIIGFTELSLDDATPGNNLDDNLQEVLAAGNRATDLVRQILTFARHTDEDAKPMNICAVLREGMNLIRSSIPAVIEIQTAFECDSVIKASATQIQQIVMNLCTNAAHAMEDDGGVLTVSVREVSMGDVPQELNDGFEPNDCIEIRVSDTGAGMSPGVIGSIFEPYFTTKGLGKGTGMGLAVVHGIVEGNGGKITVESELGKGTTFRVYWPITEDRVGLPPNEKRELPEGTERVLFVDDEVAITRLGSMALERLGYSVTTTTNSVEAVELFRSAPDDFDLVITDMTMPKMTGDVMAAEMMNIRPDIPVILCTGYSNKISDEEAKGMGIKAFAYKPLVKADLARVVRTVLDESKR